MELKLKDLRYLVAVADERHFGRAAAKCFVSQPTLSAQLRKLEESLGVQLIERRPRRVTLTEAGEDIAQRARAMLETGDAIVMVAQTRRDPLAGQLRLALLPTIGPYLLPQIALKLRKALPRLELMLYEYRTETMLERLHNGDIDVSASSPCPCTMTCWFRANCMRSPSCWRYPSRTGSPHARRSAPPTWTRKLCCCSRTATACGARRCRSAPAVARTKSWISAPPALRRCGRWSLPAPESRCCRCSPDVAAVYLSLENVGTRAVG